MGGGGCVCVYVCMYVHVYICTQSALHCYLVSPETAFVYKLNYFPRLLTRWCVMPIYPNTSLFIIIIICVQCFVSFLF